MGFYNFSGAAKAEHTDGQSGVTYNATTTSPATTTSTGNTKQCSNIYCHSTGQSLTNGSSATPTYATPIWDGAAACGTCHAASKAGVIAANSGSHAKHVSDSGVSGCDACHTGANAEGTQYISTNHVNKLIDASKTYTAGGTPEIGRGNF